ncbi:uncharacterized protein [Euwallacea fornicatus]|uniref:uncharacterized protein n=1 Tax=Euwallacea fornicatus TaxID=995702 RepID=UPI00338DDE87
MEPITRVEDQDRAITHNSIKFLDQLTNIRRLNIPTLKSLYRTKCRLMELRRQIFLPQVKPHERCHKCFMNFSEANTKFEVQSMRLTNFARKVFAKVAKGLPLTVYQKIYYKKIKKKYPNKYDQKQNKLVLTCMFCGEKTEVHMNKPQPKKTKSKATVNLINKKKPKKKDKFCGLNENVVLLSSIKKKQNQINSSAVVPDSTKAFNETQEKTTNVSISMTNTRSFLTSKLVSKVNSKSKAKITRKKKENSKEVVKPALKNVKKVNEKIQKKKLNSLGNMLKKVTENTGKTQSKLKAFLDSL